MLPVAQPVVALAAPTRLFASALPAPKAVAAPTKTLERRSDNEGERNEDLGTDSAKPKVPGRQWAPIVSLSSSPLSLQDEEVLESSQEEENGAQTQADSDPLDDSPPWWLSVP